MPDGSYNPFASSDLSAYVKKSDLLDEYRLESGNPNATNDDMFDAVMERGHKAKDVRSAIVTNGSGTATIAYPAGYWKAEPSINAVPVSATGGSGQLTVKVSKVKASDAWTITVAFAMLPAEVTVLVAGKTALWVNPGVVTFDYQAFEVTG